METVKIKMKIKNLRRIKIVMKKYFWEKTKTKTLKIGESDRKKKKQTQSKVNQWEFTQSSRWWLKKFCWWDVIQWGKEPGRQKAHSLSGICKYTGFVCLILTHGRAVGKKKRLLIPGKLEKLVSLTSLHHHARQV